jgi:membrane-associated phospholipid phosphatase
MRYIFCLLAFLCFSVSGHSDPADSTVKTTKRIKLYHVNYWVTGSIIGVGMVGDFFAISRLKNKTNLSDEELLFVNSEQQINLMNSIDRWALKQKASDRDLWTKISDYGQAGIFLLPSLLMIDKNIRRDWYDLLLIYVEGHTITFTFYNYSFLGPTFQNRCRPVTYYPEFSDEIRKSGGNRNSFYSGHVASVAYSTFFMAKVYSDYHPELGAKKYLLYLAASVPPLFIGYARIKALAHFPSDVAVGFALGAIIGIVLPQLHKTRIGKNLSLSMFDSPDGTGLTLRWKLGDHQPIILSK